MGLAIPFLLLEGGFLRGQGLFLLLCSFPMALLSPGPVPSLSTGSRAAETGLGAPSQIHPARDLPSRCAGSDSPAPRGGLKAAPGDGALGTFSLSAGSCSACLGLAPRWLSRFAWSLGLVQTHLSCLRNLLSMLGISHLFDKAGLAPFCH